jgi:hypothetical protein
MFRDNFFIGGILIVLLSTLVHFGCNNCSMGYSEMKIPSVKDAVALEIANNGGAYISFHFKIKDFPFNSLEEMKAVILSDTASGSTMHDWEKAWRFISTSTSHKLMISRENWLYHPLLLVNSAGGAYCGFRASALAQLWTTMGYEARVWGLNGHVVPEIRHENRWIMLDPDLGVFYRMSDGRIAGVEDLEKDTSIIYRKAQHDTVYTPGYSNILKYSPWIAAMYASKNDNRLFDWRLPFPSSDRNPPVLLPPGAVMEFPVHDTSFVVSGDFGEVEAGPCLKVKLPAGKGMRLSMPFVLCCVKGKAEINYGLKKISVNGICSDGLASDMSVYSPYAEVSSDSLVEMYYMIHYPAENLLSGETLHLKGSGIEQLRVTFKADMP